MDFIEAYHALEQKIIDIQRKRLPYERMQLGKATKRGDEHGVTQHTREIDRLERLLTRSQSELEQLLPPQARVRREHLCPVCDFHKRINIPVWRPEVEGWGNESVPCPVCGGAGSLDADGWARMHAALTATADR